MSAAQEIVVGVVILLGIVGGTTQLVPGGLIVLGAILVWTLMTGGALAWLVLAFAVVAIVGSGVVKYVFAGRHMNRAEVPASTLVVGMVAGVVGFFVIPVVGLFVGFVGGIYVCELSRRRDHALAWTATRAALAATGLTILVELAGSLVAGGTWLLAVVLG
ncbi:hypothetical protein SAMN05216410_1666 [Sanguibacter gelidistatuariae]|uniref:DUF456 domain-containing protein n=1 Tax=Sanguibacter gelidistatuariae TaxID=1814289 RepID=A0A1G6KRB0_9MICO|nr:DUF456 domain-containing protein [Sanguibacter gelidistatuariae]SDC33629.1 hypothetical protein SAMN05216410_1666 [Sanguibacter gelidistatuariae]